MVPVFFISGLCVCDVVETAHWVCCWYRNAVHCSRAPLLERCVWGPDAAVSTHSWHTHASNSTCWEELLVKIKTFGWDMFLWNKWTRKGLYESKQPCSSRVSWASSAVALALLVTHCNKMICQIMQHGCSGINLYLCNLSDIKCL